MFRSRITERSTYHSTAGKRARPLCRRSSADTRWSGTSLSTLLVGLLISLTMACGDDNNETELENDTVPTAESDLRTAAESAVDAAENKNNAGNSSQGLRQPLPGEELKTGTHIAKLSLTNLSVENPNGLGSALVTFSGSRESAFTASIVFDEWGPAGITGALTYTKASTGTYSLVGGLTWKGTAIAFNYVYTRNGSTVCAVGKIGGRAYDPCKVGNTDTNPDNSNLFAKCNEEATKENVCELARCAFQSGYDQCKSSAVDTTKCDTVYKTCVDTYMQCICDGNTLVQVQAEVEACSAAAQACVEREE